MKTLIFNGSPRAVGDTAALLDALVRSLDGEAEIVSCYGADLSPCVDCRACKKAFCCAIHDGMQAVYDKILAADNIAIASPIYYSELTGRTLDVLSRLQPGYYARLRGETGFMNRPRRGGILLAGGGDGSPAKAIATARALLRAMGCRDIAEPVMSLHTDQLPAAMDTAAINAARRLAEAWNRS